MSKKSKVSDEDTPPAKGAYRHPEGGWIMASQPVGGSRRIRAIGHRREQPDMDAFGLVLALEVLDQLRTTEDEHRDKT